LIVASATLAVASALPACSSKEEPPIAPGPSTSGSNQGGSQASTAGTGSSAGGSNATAGTPSNGGSAGPGNGGVGPQGGGSSTAGGPSGGNAGTGITGGAPGGAPAGGSDAGGTGGTGGLEEGDTPPWRPLKVDASIGEHVHGNAGMDTRAKKMLGKLAVDIGVNSGGYISWLAKRGYHSIGAPCGSCPAPNLGGGRDEVGECRMQEFATTAASVKQTLTKLHADFPEEDWGYFLNQDGSVRWSDVAITGISHGATTSAIAGRIGERMWRVVSRAGPRDNTCGAGNGQCSVPLSTPSYDPACPDSDVASWLDQPSKTPMNRFYALVGTTDGQCGDIMFNMHRTGYIGQPVLFNMPGAVLTGSNQFFSTQGGHYDFLRAPDGVPNTNAALNIAFGIPPENQNPDF
jgi:hypothetical protein